MSRPARVTALTDEFERYVASGEINSTVGDQAAAVERIRGWAAGTPPAPTSSTGSR